MSYGEGKTSRFYDAWPRALPRDGREAQDPRRRQTPQKSQVGVGSRTGYFLGLCRTRHLSGLGRSFSPRLTRSPKMTSSGKRSCISSPKSVCVSPLSTVLLLRLAFQPSSPCSMNTLAIAISFPDSSDQAAFLFEKSNSVEMSMYIRLRIINRLKTKLAVSAQRRKVAPFPVWAPEIERI